MALVGQPIDVPLAPMNQQAPATSGPLGGIKRLINGVAKRLQRSVDGVRLLVEKRDGFAALPTTVHDSSTGAVSSKTLTSPTLLATWRDQLLSVCGGAPFLLSEAAGCWEAPPYVAPTQVLREKHVALQNGISNAPDSARIGARTLYTWQGLSGTCWATIVDDDGTVVLQPTVALQGGGPNFPFPKCATDGTRFWILITWPTDGRIWITSFDANGVGITTFNTVIVLTAGSTIDITTDANLPTGVYVAMKNVIAGTTIIRYTWNGSSVVNSSGVVNGALCGTGRLAFLRNDSGDGNLYLATIDAAGPFDHYVWQIATPSGTPTLAHQYNVSLASAKAAFEIAGYVDPGGTQAIVVALSFLDTVPTVQFNFTEIRTVTLAGVTALARTQRSLTLATRVLRMAGAYYAIFYYRSNPAGFTNIGQSTFFMISLAAPWQVCGRWEFGTAYNDWNDTVATGFYMMLASPNVDSLGGVHFPLAYRATSQVALSQSGDAFNIIRHVVDTVGIKEWTLGPDHGQALDLVGKILLPGSEANAYSGGTFTEDGIPLLYEVPAAPAQAGGGNLTLLGTYQYVIVPEWTDNAGNRVRGPAGPPITVTLTGANNKITITGYNIHVSRKFNLMVAVYRTIWNATTGVQSTIHYKVSGTIIGGAFGGPVVYNDDSSNTWTFVDVMPDVLAAVNDQLYVDSGQLDHFPAPPFSVGCEAFGRAFVVAPDNSIWFSGDKTEGEDFWFHPGQRIVLPTHERVKQIRRLDNFLLVMCEKTALFTIPKGPFPDATGQGTIPTPDRLPFANGCTGFAETTAAGVIYSAAQGGLWIVTRDLQNLFIGAAVQNDTASGIAASATDAAQRVYFLTNAESIVVFDQVTNCWYVWLVTIVPGMTNLAMHKGALAFMSANFPSQPYRQSVGAVDDGGTAIPTTLTIEFMRFGGIRNYKRAWEAQLQGEYRGDHDLTVTCYVDDDAVNPEAVYTFTPAATTPYIYALPPVQELCSSRSYTFVDSFPRGPSAGYALELMSFLIGLEKGLGRQPATSSIKPT